MKSKKSIVKITALALIAAMAATMVGCRASDEIQKIVYTRDASDVDDTEFTREWSKEAEELDDESQEPQDQQEADKTEQEMEEEQTTDDPSVDAAAPTEAEDDTANTDEAAQVAAADETGNNAVSNGSDDVTGQNGATGAASDAENNDSDAVSDTGSGGDATASSSSSDGGDSSSDSANTGDGTGDGGAEGSGDGEGSSTEAGDNSASEDEREPRKQIYDSDGRQIDVPDSVDTIVAAGEAALITQMLGGEGVLLASSSDFLSNSLVQSVFADEGISEVETLWDGDGSEPMSDESFARLLELDPDCVLTMSGEANFSTDQEAQLKEAQIYIVALPALTSSDNIDAAVETVGQVLDDHEVGDTTSLDLAEQYVAYEENLVSEVEGKKGTFAEILSTKRDYFKGMSSSLSNGDWTLVLWDWDDSFSFTYTYGGTNYIDQSGGAVLHMDCTVSPAAYYMSAAGVMDTAERVSSSNKCTVFVPYYTIRKDYYLTDEDQNQNRVSTSAGLGSLGIFGNGSLEMSGSTYNSTYSTTTSYSGSNYKVDGFSMWAALGYTSWTSSSPYYVSGAYAWLGTDRFPYAIAATQDIKSKMESSKDSATGLYRIRTWGIEINEEVTAIAQQQTLYLGTHPGQSGLVVNGNTTSRQEYEIIVNPSGCGNWLNGSVESMLEAVWTSNLYYGDETYNDGDRDDVIRDFYKTFYRHNLTSTELEDILDGE